MFVDPLCQDATPSQKSDHEKNKEECEQKTTQSALMNFESDRESRFDADLQSITNLISAITKVISSREAEVQRDCHEVIIVPSWRNGATWDR